MTPTRIRFHYDMLVRAVELSMKRTADSIGRKDNWGLVVPKTKAGQIEDARRQVIGTLGEWAVANYFNTDYVFSVNTFKEPDVWVTGNDGKVWGLQVKASEYGKNFIIRPDAKNHEPYIYCLVEMPEGDPRMWAQRLPKSAVAFVSIKGWMFPSEARERAKANPSLIRDPGGRKSPAIFIPVPQINPISELRQAIYGSV